jgi:hypothetical protein
MTVSAFALAIFGATLPVAFVPAWVAHLRHTLFSSDLALIAVPALLLYGSGVFFNPELSIGFGLFAYPYLAFVLCIAVLYVRVFLLDHWHRDPRRNSLICLFVASVLSVVIGAVVPPLYE